MGNRDRNATWVKIYRGIMNSSVWEDDKRFKAWMYILLETSFSDRTRYPHGRQVKLKRGECFTSIRGMARSIGCEPKTVKRILHQFEEDGMITVRIVPGLGAIINPLKYKDFQSGNIPDDYTDDLTDDYTDDLTDDYTDDLTDDYYDDHYESPHHKNYKNGNTKKGKKEKNKPAAPESAPDDGGPIPDDWSDAKERDWRETNRINDGFQTRAEWRAEGIKYNLWDRYEEEGME